MAELSKKNLEHLTDLARLELTDKESEKFLADLGKILYYFKELQEVDTEDIQPLTGGTELKTIVREDEVFKTDHYSDGEKIIAQFPEEKNRFLKIPPVFE